MRVPVGLSGVTMGVLAFGDFEVDLDLFHLRRCGQRIEIGTKAFDLLVYLINHRERVVSKAELLANVWHAQALSNSAIPTAVLELRKRLGDDSGAPRFILNTPGRGYRFIAGVVEPIAGAETSGSAARAAIPQAVGQGFVGRDSELSVVRAAFERCRNGVPQTVLLAGEAGIGKTRLAEVFSAQARTLGATILVGRCREGEGAPAFWPWVQVVRGLVEGLTPQSLETDVRRLAPVLAQMVPELAQLFPDLIAPPPLDAEPARFRLFDTVTRLLKYAGSERPLVVILDDLHQADPASLHFLAFVVRELRQAAVLLLVTYRDFDAQRNPARLEAITELARQEPSRSIHLHGLSAAEVAEFISASLLPDSGSKALARALYDQSGGNPFFLTQLVHLLEAQGGALDVESGSRLPVSLPGGVRDAIARQLDGLPNDTRRTLRIAAAIGREFSSATVADVLGLSMRAALAALQPAIDARLVAVVPERISYLRFAHVLLRDSVYDQLDPAERSALHERIACSLERLYADDLGPHAAELAYHFLESLDCGGPEPAVRFAIQAGDWASARLAYEDAARHYRSAVSILDNSGPGKIDQRCEVLLALGEAEMNMGDRERARRTFYVTAGHAKRGGRSELLARAALRIAPGFFTIEIGVVDEPLVNLLEDALSAIGTADSPLRAQLLARLAMALGWSGVEERRRALTVEAIDVAKRLPDAGTLAYALSAYHGLLWGPERIRERAAVIDEMEVLANKSRNTELILIHLVFRITLGFEQGRIDQVDRDIAAYVRIAEPLNQPQSLWYIHTYRAARALMQGRVAEASKHAESLLVVGGRLSDVNAVNTFGIHAAIQLWEGDRTSEVLPIADQFVHRYPLIPAWQFSRAFMYFEAGHEELARAQFEKLADDDFSILPRNEQWTTSIVLAADLCCRLEDRARARSLYARLLPARSQYSVIGFGVATIGSIALRLGMLATLARDWESAEEHFEEAIQMEERVGSIPWLAHTLYWQARSLSTRGRPSDIDRARDLSGRGIDLAVSMSLTRVKRNFEALRHALVRRA